MTAPAGEGPSATDDLLERDREIAGIDAAVAGAARGDGGMVLIEGPAGIGKTRLIQQARRRAEERGMRVLTARGSEIERDFAFGVVRQLVEGLLVDADVAERAFAGAARGARPIFGSLDADGAEGDASFAALHGLYWLVVNLAGDGPLLLVVDDLHWADRSSLRFVAYLAGRLEALPVGVVAGLRTAEPGTDPALVAEITRDPGTRVLAPGPLSADATSALIAGRVGDADQGFAAACHRATGGNPLLLTELLRALAAEGVAMDAIGADAVAGVGSRAVSRAVLARLSRLSPDAVKVTRALAVLGDGSDLRLVAQLAGVDPAAAAAATGELARAEILLPETPLGFVHPLVRHAVHSDVAPGERERSHERAAALLAAAGAPDERIAAHLLQMARSGDPAVVDTLQRAARVATARGAPDSAVAYMRRALEEPPPPERRAEVVFELGRLEVMTNGPDAAVHLAEARDTLTDPRTRATATYELARTLVFTGRAREARDVVLQTASELPPGLEDVRRGLEAMAHMTVFFGAGEHDDLRGLDAWRDPGEVLGVGTLLLMAMGGLEWSLTGGTAAEASAVAMRALADGRLVEVDDNLIYVAAAIVPALADRPEALEVWDALRARTHRKGSLIGALTVHLWRGYALMRRGEMAEAEESVRSAAEEMVAWGTPPPLLAYPAALLTEILVERGDLPGARAAAQGLSVPPTADVARLLLGARLGLLLAEGRDEEVVALADEYRRRFPRIVNPAWAPWRPLAAEALARLGRADEALDLMRAEVAQARTWGGPGALGRALRVLGVIERDAGLPALEESVGVLDGSPARLELAKSLVALGTALRLARRPTDARGPLARGLSLAVACGAPPLAARARAELQAAGVRARADALSGVGALTASERRVADLATEGYTNKDIAQLLYVTPKTIEVHLSSVYRKLGIRSRRELPTALQPA
jgi:DNA-binding CsgD family transcriptional regulator/tetratricopeptide (TPR) repeat protein